MFTFINLLKNFENKISQTEMIETQYTSREYYQNENFNLNSFTRVITDKIKDSSNLIKILDSSINEIKDEILTQINSNFSNHLILISKIQTVDYLIDNIEKPLYLIRNKMKNKLNLLEKNENELKTIIDNLNNNEKSLRYSKICFSYYKFISQAKFLEKTILNMQGSNVFKCIIENADTSSLLIAYEFLKTLLIHSYRFLSVNEKNEIIIRDLRDILIDKDTKNKNKNDDRIKNNNIMNDIAKSLSIDDFIEDSNNQKRFEDQIFAFLDRILESCLKEIGQITNKKAKEEIFCYKTFLRLIYDCYRIKLKQHIFYEKIKNFIFKNNINEILTKEEISFENFDKITNSGKIEMFRQMEDFLEEKYIFLYDVVKNNRYEFNLICIWNPIVEKLYTNKKLFLCIDPETFSKILNSLLNLMKKYPVSSFEELTYKFHYHNTNDDDFSSNPRSADKNRLKYLNEIIKKPKCSKKMEYSNDSYRKSINSFFQSFSYFTYFQFIQNDLTKIIMNSSIIKFDNDGSNLETNNNLIKFDSSYIHNQVIKELNDFSNLLFNFNNYNYFLFKEKRLFLKNTANYINFVYGNYLFISKKILDYFISDKNKFEIILLEESKLHLLKDENNLTNQSDIGLKNKGIIKEFLKNVCNYFESIGDLVINLHEILHREIFIFHKLEDIERLKVYFKKLKQTSILRNLNQQIIDSKYFNELLKFQPELDKQAIENLINSN